MFNSMKQAAEKAAAAASAAASAAAKQGIGAAKEAKEKLTTNSKPSTAKPVVPDSAAVEQLVSMGFTRTEAEQALVQAGSSSVEAAAELLCSKGWKPAAQGQPQPASTPAPARGTSASAATTSTSSASTSTVQERMRASLKDVKRKAESMLGKAQASMPSSLPGSSAAAAADLGPSMPFVSLASSPAQRRANAEAAERRLAEARARNAGTMEDWRRYRQEQGQVRTSRTLARDTLQHRPVATVAGNVSFGHRPPSVVYVGVDDDEGEDVQRALAASLAPASAIPAAPKAATAQSKPESEPLVASATQAAAATAETAATEEVEAPPAAAASASAAAAAAEEGGGVEAEDPELFELMLQQALAEEELELQQALTHSIEAERALLEQERVEAACKAAAETTAPEEPTEAGEEDAGKADLKDIEEQLAESLARERQVLEEQSAMQARVEELRRQVAEREGEASGPSAAADPEDAVAVETPAAAAVAATDVAPEADTAGAEEPDVEVEATPNPGGSGQAEAASASEETSEKAAVAMEAPSAGVVLEETAEKAVGAAAEPAEKAEPETEVETEAVKTAELEEKPLDEPLKDVVAEEGKADPEAKIEASEKEGDSEAPTAATSQSEAQEGAKTEAPEDLNPTGMAAPTADEKSKREGDASAEDSAAALVEKATEAKTAEPAEEAKANPHPESSNTEHVGE